MVGYVCIIYSDLYKRIHTSISKLFKSVSRCDRRFISYLTRAAWLCRKGVEFCRRNAAVHRLPHHRNSCGPSTPHEKCEILRSPNQPPLFENIPTSSSQETKRKHRRPIDFFFNIEPLKNTTETARRNHCPSWLPRRS